jgi:Tol biopolymer transport system component
VVFERLDDIFVRDTVADTTLILSPPLLSPDPRAVSRDPALSADGRFVAFLSSVVGAGSTERLYLYDRAAGTYVIVNHAPGLATTGDGLPISFALSADGRYVAYQCGSCGLVAGHTTLPPSIGFLQEIFLYDRLSGENTLVSRAVDTSQPAFRSNGPAHGPAISADGRYVAFWSFATNLVSGQADAPNTEDLFVFDRVTGASSLVTSVPGFPATAASRPGIQFLAPAVLSADGRFIAFPSIIPDLVPGQVDTGSNVDVFLHDQGTRTTVLVSHAASSPVTVGNRESYPAALEDPISMSDDGRFLVYQSQATDLAAGATDTNGAGDVFLYDRLTGTNTLVSHAAGHPLQAGNAESETPRISAKGGHIAFLSGATDLTSGPAVPHLSAGSRNLYVQDRSTGTTAFIAQALRLGRPFNPFPSEEELFSFGPRISADGRRIAFTSDSAIVPGDYNRTWDVYLWDEDGTAGPENPEGPVTVPPCRLLDTRRRAERPILTSNVRRTVAAHGRCGVPATARQVVVKVTAFNPSGKGNLRFYAGDVTATPSGILRFERGTTRTETFTLTLGTNGTLTILPFVAGRGTVHGLVEVTGYAN